MSVTDYAGNIVFGFVWMATGASLTGADNGDHAVRLLLSRLNGHAFGEPLWRDHLRPEKEISHAKALAEL